ncbi:PaaI family thioesterase [Erythrobacter sp. 3-20A1M]|uniref:PaaI family thioesterase n=1 Tax=Erythrobacter sp. 3-20A1M TaxID=2653850 RepID=UPI001BFC805F|nr:PaaI family thioesterase [Erythrobacter sp. 3-20A1M]QWC55741.1 PaaI family thioesterase [Erythrobacter sp. 3-20A1M]
MAIADDAFETGPDPDHPGWNQWNLRDETLFNTAVLGRLIVRREDERCRLRMFPQRRHENLQGMVHGAATQGLIDIALFATLHTLGRSDAGPSVTLEISTQFIGGGDPNRPLDAVSEVMRETGRLLFVRGTVEQDDDIVAAYSGIVRKLPPR